MPEESPLDRLRPKLQALHLDGLLVTQVVNVQYLSGFSGDDTYLLIPASAKTEAFLITDFRYVEQAHQETKGFRIIRHKQGLIERVADLVKDLRIKKLGFEGDSLSFSQVKSLAKKIPRKTRLKPTTGVITQLRAIKTLSEILKIRKAIICARDAFLKIKRHLKSGISEEMISTELEYEMRRLGATKPAFNTIVAANERASLPHGRSSKNLLKKPGLVQFDWGACVDAYHSDISRVVFMGKPSSFWRKIYQIVLEAQRRAILLVKPGIIAAEVDKVARGYIASQGYGKYFGHGLGHGIGRAVHELPRLNSRSKNTLEPGMVFTIEPAIYLPGKGGIRIEDIVLVTPEGGEVLTQSIPKEIDEITINSN